MVLGASAAGDAVDLAETEEPGGAGVGPLGITDCSDVFSGKIRNIVAEHEGDLVRARLKVQLLLVVPL